MNILTFISYFFMLAAAVSATGILLSRNVFKAALMLLVCLLSIAALYVLSFAEFVAITQILVYAGGVLVVIIFGIMLTSKLSGKPLQVGHTNIFVALLSGILLFVLLANFIADDLFAAPQHALETQGALQTIGTNLMTTYALPFEIAGILLLVALIGAAVITSFMKSKKA
jgi:NADH:ubiquinone oxidoreductase subunit 6 (subunit J)